ncbi:MAG: flagellar filament capping protein FliD, partial [Anaerotignum sp.]
SILNITSSSTGVMGETGVFGIKSGATNKLNTTTALENSGLKDVESLGLVDGQEYDININGESIKFTYTAGKTSLGDILNAINNNEEAGVKIAYNSNSDSFSMTSTNSGASGQIEIGTSGELNDMERLLFGKRDSEGKIDSSSNEINGTVIQGQDAIVLVDFDGEGGSDATEISRGSNTFTLDGMTIGVKGTFGFDTDGNYVSDTEAITFDATADTTKIVDAIKSMINDYNSMIASVNSAKTEQPDRDYAPLTDEQKEEMSEDEIAAWETEAKKGLLFSDPDINSLSSDLRFAFLSTSVNGVSLSDIGISVSSDWSENGKITLDESKLEAALAENPDNVRDLMIASSDGSSTTTGGVMTRMKYITDKYAKTTGATKGILVEKAGNEKSATSLLKNSLLTQMDDIDAIIERLETKLETERTRYQTQFTALEQIIQQSNTQSSWLSQLSA